MLSDLDRDLRRQLGFALTAQATELMRFARFADACGHRDLLPAIRARHRGTTNGCARSWPSQAGTAHPHTDAEILELLQHAGRLTPVGGLRPLMYRTPFGLIASVGLRLSEALKLRVGDVHLQAATITGRQTKLHKSRCLPIHPSVVQELMAYRRVGDHHTAHDMSAPFFVSRTGGFLPDSLRGHVRGEDR
ncbi:MAG TPA: tyrosine-type recombinase/integrase [Burkholderiaceae bacterium]|nr:tyrosine-type recombinase/integrase [Burkholderiaceae bacterium]